MSNPVSPFRNNLFASRGCNIQEALNYAEMMINTLSAVDQVSIRTAFGVVLNTIDSAVTQSQGPSPEMDQADMLSQLGGIYDKLVSDVASKVVARDQATIESIIGEWAKTNLHDIDQQISNWMSNDNNLRDKVMDIIANEDDIDDQISNWMSNNFDVTDYNVDDAIESWMDNNLDEKVSEAIGNVEFNVTVR